MRKTLLALVLFAMPALAGAPVSTHILTTDKTVIGQPNDVPLHPTVIASMVTFQPGDKTAAHKHPFPHYGYVLEGTLTIVNTETGKSFDVKTGEFLVEMVNTNHYGENRGATPVKNPDCRSGPPRGDGEQHIERVIVVAWGEKNGPPRDKSP